MDRSAGSILQMFQEAQYRMGYYMKFYLNWPCETMSQWMNQKKSAFRQFCIEDLNVWIRRRYLNSSNQLVPYFCRPHNWILQRRMSSNLNLENSTKVCPAPYQNNNHETAYKSFKGCSSSIK
jgi:hypothetical protein